MTRVGGAFLSQKESVTFITPKTQISMMNSFARSRSLREVRKLAHHTRFLDLDGQIKFENFLL